MKLVPLKTGRTCQPIDSFVHHRITRIPLPGERKLYNYPVNNYHDRVCDHRSPVSLTIFNCARFSVRIAYLPLPFYFIENLRRFPRTTSTSDKFLLFSLSLSLLDTKKKIDRIQYVLIPFYLRERNQLLRKFVIPLLSIYEKH